MRRGPRSWTVPHIRWNVLIRSSDGLPSAKLVQVMEPDLVAARLRVHACKVLVMAPYMYHARNKSTQDELTNPDVAM